MTTVTIHQPEYLPWPGLIDKARRADVLVVLDDVQFNRASLQHRARIAHPDGRAAWLTIPFVHRYPQLIRDVAFADPEWARAHAVRICDVYRGAPNFARAWADLEVFFATPYRTVAEATEASMAVLFRAFGVTTPTVRSSTLGADGARGDRVLDICRRLSATTYLSGRTGATYLDADAFAEAGVEIAVQEFTPPRTRPLAEGAEKGLSAIDAWMYGALDTP